MKQYPANMADFMDMFPTEDACLEYLSVVRWPDEYQCLRCGKGITGRRPVAFSLAAHAGTRFGAGRHTVSGYAQTAPLMVSGDVVCGEPEKRRQRPGLQRALGLGSYHTAWEWLHKLRRAMVRPGRDRLSGIVASLLKRWWLGTHRGAIRPDHLAYYLDEFTFRFNRRTSRSRGKLLYRLIEGALQTDPVPAKTLTHNI